MKKGLIVFISILGGLLVIVLFILGYYGLFTPTAKILGTNKPKDLGVTYTEEDLKVVTAKLNLEKIESPSGTATKYEGSRDINESFTSAELSALVNSSQWSLTPISNVQIKIGNDGFAESSGVLDLSLLPAYFDEVTPGIVTEDEFNKATSLLPESIPYYVSGNINYSDGQVYLNLSGAENSILSKVVGRVYASGLNLGVASATVGKFNIPNAILESSQGRVNSFLNQGLGHIKGLEIDSLNFDNGSMNLKGKVPTKKYRPVK